MKLLFIAVALMIASVATRDTSKPIRVFIALCDNKSQGIVPVRERIGNGDKPEDNLYWGCSEGFGQVFPRSKNWKVIGTEKDVTPEILRRMKLRHVGSGQEMIVEAYRGSAMKECLVQFEQAVASRKHDIVAYIGHNGLMDFELPQSEPIKTDVARSSRSVMNKTEAIVLCCLSERYFAPRLRRLGAQPILLTTQLMYPASAVLHDVIEKRKQGGTLKDCRMAAAKAYATNQEISVKAAAGVFSVIDLD